jgi:hypothetical protein
MVDVLNHPIWIFSIPANSKNVHHASSGFQKITQENDSKPDVSLRA